MARKSNMFMVLLAVGVIAILVMGGIVTWSVMSQQSALDEAAAAAQTSGPTSLQGKTAVVSVYAYDHAVDSPSTTKRNVPLYLFVGNGDDPIQVTPTKVSGKLAADGTALSSTARTDISDGMNVGKNILGIAVNNTYYGDFSTQEAIKEQAETYDVKVWTVASTGGKVTWYDEDGTSIATAGDAGTANVTIGASDAYTFEKMKVENNNTDKAWRVAGFYIQKETGGNMSAYTMSGSTTGDVVTGIKKDSTKYSLESKDNVDVVFVFDTPVLLLENDQVFTPGFTVESDGDGCAVAESIGTFKWFDANWFRSSSDETAVVFGAETDATSPADVAASDLTAPIIHCKTS